MLLREKAMTARHLYTSIFKSQSSCPPVPNIVAKKGHSISYDRSIEKRQENLKNGDFKGKGNLAKTQVVVALQINKVIPYASGN